MVKAILDGICKALGDFNIPIYTEYVDQGLQEPCFFVTVEGSSLERIRDKRYNFTADVRVVYCPEQGRTQREDMYDISIDILDSLEYIDADGLIEGNGLKCQYLADESGWFLEASGSYSCTIYKEKEKIPKMEELEVKYGKAEE